MALSADGSLAAAPAVPPGKGLIVWDVAAGKERLRLPWPERGWAIRVAIAPDNQTLAMTSEEGPFLLWDLTSGKQRLLLREGFGHSRPVFSPDGKLLALAGVRGGATVVEVVTGQVVGRVAGDGPLTAVAVSPDARTVAGAHGGGVSVWELPAAKERLTLTGHEGEVRSLRFSPDGRLLASGGADTTVLLWDMAKLRPPAEPRPTDAELLAAWEGLASDDAATGYAAMARLAAAPGRSVPFLRSRLLPDAPDAGRLRRLVADLAADRVETARRAMAELEVLGPKAKPALEEALSASTDADEKLRLGVLLRKLGEPDRPEGRLKVARLVQALEAAGTAEARALLARLAEGTELAADARAAHDRLVRRTGKE
jgi:hypothetical protein